MKGSTDRMEETALPGASSRNNVLVSDAQRQALHADIRQPLVTALMRSGDAVTDPQLARLPDPVRYRVMGALAACDALRTATDRVASAVLTEMLCSNGILRLTRYYDCFTRDLLSHGADGRARDAQVVNDRAYSNAPRHFPWLGNRKRTERLAEIEQLHDRHVVGPTLVRPDRLGL